MKILGRDLFFLPYFAVASVAMLLAPRAGAVDIWDGGGGNDNWTTGANWFSLFGPGAPPANNGTADIVFPATGGLVQTPIVNVPYSINSMQFGNGDGRFVVLGSSELTIGSGGIANNDTDIQSVIGPVKLSADQTWNAAAGPLQIDTVNLNGFDLTLAGAHGIDLFSLNVAGGSVAANGGALSISGQLNMTAGAISGAGTLNVNSPITSNASSASASITTNTLDLGGGTRNFTVAQGTVADDLVIASVLANGGLSKNGDGQLVLSGFSNNTYTGLTTINAGTLVLAKSVGSAIFGDLIIGDGLGGSNADIVRANAIDQFFLLFDMFGNYWTDITINGSGLLDLNGYDQSIHDLAINGGAVTTGSGALIVYGFVTTDASATTSTISGNLSMRGIPAYSYPYAMMYVADGPDAIDLDISASISSVEDFYKGFTGTLALTGSTANTFSGTLRISNGTVILNKSVPDGAISGSVIIGYNLGGGLDFGPSTVRLANSEQIAGTVIVSPGHTFDMAGFSESVVGASVLGSLITGGGTLTAQNFTLSSTTVDTAAGVVTVTGMLRYLNYAGATPATLAGKLSLGGGTRTVDIDNGVADADLTISAVISSGGLTKTGAGTLLMSGPANSYTGPTTVQAGSLLLGKTGNDGAIAGTLAIGDGNGIDVVRLLASEQILAVPGNTVTVNSSGTLDLAGFNETIQDLAMNGGAVTTGGGMLLIQGALSTSGGNTSPSTLTGLLDLTGGTRSFTINDGLATIDLDVSAAISNGGISKLGSGTLRLGGNCSFSGGVNHQAGRLLVAHDNALGTGTLSLDGTTIEASNGARNLSNPVVVSAFSGIAGSEDLSLSGSLTTNLGASLVKSGTGVLTLAGLQTHAAGTVLIATAGTVNFDSSATGSTLNVNLNNDDTVVDFNADQDLDILAVNGGRVAVSNNSLLGVSSLSIDSDAVLELEIGGLVGGDDFAQLLVSGNAALGGTLDIQLVNGFIPSIGQSYTMLTAADVDFEFTTESFPSVPGMIFDVIYNAQSVVLTVSPAFSADFDNDGDVDGDDLTQWEGDYGQNGFSDADDDNDSDGFDFLAWQQQFGSGVGVPFAAATTIPEPSSLLPAALGLLTLSVRRKRA